ncbi:hypothetical protein RI367_007501 [Sorochytrium milnesiophthora]
MVDPATIYSENVPLQTPLDHALSWFCLCVFVPALALNVVVSHLLARQARESSIGRASCLLTLNKLGSNVLLLFASMGPGLYSVISGRYAASSFALCQLQGFLISVAGFWASIATPLLAVERYAAVVWRRQHSTHVWRRAIYTSMAASVPLAAIPFMLGAPFVVQPNRQICLNKYYDMQPVNLAIASVALALHAFDIVSMSWMYSRIYVAVRKVSQHTVRVAAAAFPATVSRNQHILPTESHYVHPPSHASFSGTDTVPEMDTKFPAPERQSVERAVLVRAFCLCAAEFLVWGPYILDMVVMVSGTSFDASFAWDCVGCMMVLSRCFVDCLLILYLDSSSKQAFLDLVRSWTVLMSHAIICLGVDIALSVVIIAVQLVNVYSARQFLRKKTLSRWLLNAFTASFLFGAIGGLLALVQTGQQLMRLQAVDRKDTLSHLVSVAILLQGYFQGIVSLQLPHVVNAYRVDADAITLLELLQKRWPEAILTVPYACTIAVQFIPAISFELNCWISLAWLAGNMALDVILSITTFSKVHRMLNTHQTALSWAWHALRSRRATVAILYLASWLAFPDDPYLSYIAYQLAWIFGSVWQRGGLFYLEAVRIVAMQNRASKQYLGTLTQTGILQDSTTHDCRMSDATICLGVDIALSIAIIAMQMVNVYSAHQFLRMKTISRWLINAYTTSFLFGAVGGVLALTDDGLQLAGLETQWNEDTLTKFTSLALFLQTYFQGIVSLQLPHIVNAYRVDEDVITLLELVKKRWPEATLTVVGVGILVVQVINTISYEQSSNFSLAWLVAIIALDVVLSITTFNKVHRMLNTHQTALSWAWQALRSRRSTVAGSLARQSTSKLSDGQASWRVVSTWLLLTLSIVGATLLYLASMVIYTTDPYLSDTTFQLAWIFGSMWQRAGLFYLEAVRIVAMQNRASKHKWMINAYTASFMFGAGGGILALAIDGLQLVWQHAEEDMDIWSSFMSLTLILQTYFQGIVILQRPHIVNAYRVDSDAITLLELLRKRWPEAVLSVTSVGIAAVQFSNIGVGLRAELSLTWVTGIIALDVVLSITTFNKVHRMLNTHQTALSWAWQALRSRRSTVAGSLARQSTSKLSDGQASWRVVSAWVLLTLSIVCAALIYLASWLAFPDDPYLSYTAYQLAWIFGSVWQRGGLFYLEAVRIVAMQNRASKQYLGTLTRTGIKPVASVATRAVEVSKECAT